jgi:hypothetical protein
MPLKEEEWRVNARDDLGQRRKKKERVTVGPTRQRVEEEGEGNSSGWWLAGPRAISMAGLVWHPEAFSIFFDFSSFSFLFSFETILFEF